MAAIFRCSYVSKSASGVSIVNTFHTVCHDSSLLTGDTPASAVRDALHAALTTKYRACIPASITVGSLVVREELAPGSPDVPEESSQTINLAGTLTAPSPTVPLSMGLMVSLYTDAAVRSGHGRMFLPGGVQTSALSGAGLWDSSGTLWTAAGAFFDELLLNHTGGGFFTGFDAHTAIYSRTRRARGDSRYWFDVVSYTRRQQPHWLRSRATAP